MLKPVQSWRLSMFVTGHSWHISSEDSSSTNTHHLNRSMKVKAIMLVHMLLFLYAIIVEHD